MEIKSQRIKRICYTTKDHISSPDVTAKTDAKGVKDDEEAGDGGDGDGDGGDGEEGEEEEGATGKKRKIRKKKNATSQQKR